MMTSPRPSRQSSTPRARATARATSPTPPRAVWAGLDVAKATFEAALDRPGREADPQDPLSGLPGRGFERTPKGASEFLAWALLTLPAGTTLAVVMEATGRYSSDLASWLRAANEDVSVVIADPWKIHHFGQSLGTRNRTDRVDARVIARFGTERRPKATPEPTPEYESLRELTREHRRLVEERCRLENRMSEGTSVALVHAQWAKELALLRRHEEALEKEIARATRESEVLRQDNASLQQIDGFGPRVASTLQAEGSDPRRFRTSRAYVAFCGYSPARKESGTSVHGPGRLSKRGSPAIRKILYLAAMAAVRTKKSNRFQRYYRQRVREGMRPIVALIAVARKMLVTAHCMITRGVDYDDAHQPTWRSDRHPTEEARHAPAIP